MFNDGVSRSADEVINRYITARGGYRKLKAMKYFLRLSDVENLKCKLEQSVSSRTLARELGVDCEVVREL
jgi:hypothetical protein